MPELFPPDYPPGFVPAPTRPSWDPLNPPSSSQRAAGAIKYRNYSFRAAAVVADVGGSNDGTANGW